MPNMRSIQRRIQLQCGNNSTAPPSAWEWNSWVDCGLKSDTSKCPRFFAVSLKEGYVYGQSADLRWEVLSLPYSTVLLSLVGITWTPPPHLSNNLNQLCNNRSLSFVFDELLGASCYRARQLMQLFTCSRWNVRRADSVTGQCETTCC